MNRNEARAKAEALVAKMTIEERASQLKFNAKAIERLGIPEYNWWNEALHGVARAGVATVFPQAIGLAATFDLELMDEIASCIATEGRAKYNEQKKRGDRDIYKGITFWSPNVNIFRDPRWGRGHETFGEDPYLTSRMGVHYIQSLQGDGEYLKAAACAKHFAVHSGPEKMRHYFDAVVSPKDMEETYLPAFEACVTEGKVEAVMGAYNRTNGEPCCANHNLMEHYLRGRWKFEGHYVSDCWAVRDFHESHKVTKTPEESVKLALETGCDLNCGCTYEKVMHAWELGMLEEKYITESCIRLFTTRFLLGMFDKTEWDDLGWSDIECREHIAVAHRAACESVVLLKNDGVLPLQKEKLKTIGVIGPDANSRQALIGNYHGTSSRYVTVLEGIQDYVGEDVRVLYAQGCHLYKDNIEALSKEEVPDGMAEAKMVADNSDIVILVLGLDETLEGEQGDTGNSDASGDKWDLRFPKPQQMLLEEMLSYCQKPLILLNMTGSAMALGEADKKASAVLQLWYPGARGGSDVARLLFGEQSPSGKLPVTFYASEKDLPEFTDYSMKNRTYRFFTGTPVYPFGFGLTYGDCRVESLHITKRYKEDGAFDGCEAEVTVANPGRETDDVLQIYVKDEDYALAVPNPSLSAFLRIHLEKDGHMTFWIPVEARAFTSVTEQGERGIMGKHFSVYAGFSQPDARSRELMGHACQKADLEI